MKIETLMKRRGVTECEIRSAVRDTLSTHATLKRLGLRISGDNYGFFERVVRDYNIDVSHHTGQSQSGERNWSSNRIPLKELLVKDRYYNSFHLKHRLWDAEILPRCCKECGQGETWNGKPLALHLDHINGNHSDNRLENLQILCPNCHTQTPTWGTKIRDLS